MTSLNTTTTTSADVFFSEKSNIRSLPFGRLPVSYFYQNVYMFPTSKGNVTVEFSDDCLGSKVFGIWHLMQEHNHGICVIFEQQDKTKLVTIYTNSKKKTEIFHDSFFLFDVAHGTFATTTVLDNFVRVKVFDAFTLNFLFHTPAYKFCLCEESNDIHKQCKCLSKFQNSILEIKDVCVVFIEILKDTGSLEWELIKYYRDQKEFTKLHVHDIIKNSKLYIQDLDLLQARYNILFYANDVLCVDIIDDSKHVVVFDTRNNIIKKVLLPTNHFKPLFDCIYMPITHTYACFWHYYDIMCIVIMHYDYQHFCKEYVISPKTKLYVLEFVDGHAVIEINDNSANSISLIDWIPFNIND